MLCDRRHHLKLCMKILSKRERISWQLMRIYETLNRINFSNWPNYVLSKLYRTFEKRFPTEIELEVIFNYEQILSQITIILHVFESESFTVRERSIECNSPKRGNKKTAAAHSGIIPSLIAK